ncbi:hypothetical protein ABPG72_022087 [Tetrahymena utriculariae]
MNKREISAIIKNTCVSFSQSEIFLLLDLLEKNKPQFQYLLITERTLYAKQRQGGVFTQQGKAKKMSCLQMKVFDKKENKQKCIEIFSQDQFGSTYDLAIHYAQQSKFLVRKSQFLNILDSYRINEDMPFYFVEYEDFDYSSQDLDQKFIFGVQNDDQFDQQIKDYLYNIYLNLKQVLSPYHQQINESKADILLNASFVFQQLNNQLIAKLHIVDPYLFQRQENMDNLEEKKVLVKIPFEKIIKFLIIQNFQQSSFQKDVQQNHQLFFQNHQSILEHIVNTSEKFSKFCLLKINEQKDCFLLQIIINDFSSKYFQISKFQSIQEGQNQLQMYTQIQNHLHKVKIQTNVNFEITSNIWGTYKIQFKQIKDKMIGFLFGTAPQPNPLKQFEEQYCIFAQCLNIATQLINSFQTLLQHNIYPDEIYVSQDMKLTVRECAFQLQFFPDKFQIKPLPEYYFNIMSKIIMYFGNYFSARLLITSDNTFVPQKNHIANDFIISSKRF